MAGYSGTPLAKKLGIKAGMRVVLKGAPDGVEALLSPLPEGATLAARARPKDNPFLMVFVTKAGGLQRQWGKLKGQLAPDGMLWVAWPKKSSAIPSDLSRDPIREMGLAAGLVDVKVCAVDDDWSGLKFVYRLKDRG